MEKGGPGNGGEDVGDGSMGGGEGKEGVRQMGKKEESKRPLSLPLSLTLLSAARYPPATGLLPQ